MKELQCVYCDGKEFEVDVLYAKFREKSAWRYYQHNPVSVGESGSEEEGISGKIYAHVCKECGYMMLFKENQTKKDSPL